MANTPETPVGDPSLTMQDRVQILAGVLQDLYDGGPIAHSMPFEEKVDTERRLETLLKKIDPGISIVTPSEAGDDLTPYPEVITSQMKREYSESLGIQTQEVDHGQVQVDYSGAGYNANHGETGAFIPRAGGTIPLETDHGLPGQTSYDPNAPYIDSSSGESTQWVDPAGGSSFPPEMG